MSDFASKATRLKDQAGLSNRDLAAAADVGESTLSRYLSGKVQPPHDVACRILKVLEDAAVDPSPGGKADCGVEVPANMADVYERRIVDLKRTLTVERREKYICMIALAALVVFVGIMIAMDILTSSAGWIQG